MDLWILKEDIDVTHLYKIKIVINHNYCNDIYININFNVERSECEMKMS